MSEEKLYMVKNDNGKYWDFKDCRDNFWKLSYVLRPTTPSKKQAEIIVNEQGGHIVTLIEEPEKVALTKEQAIIVENAHFRLSPATFIYDSNEKDEELLMNAYVNGYTVAEEKKYYVKVPHTKDGWYFKSSEEYLLTICSSDKELHGKFTEVDIEHYGLQDCEREEVTDE